MTDQDHYKRNDYVEMNYLVILHFINIQHFNSKTGQNKPSLRKSKMKGNQLSNQFEKENQTTRAKMLIQQNKQDKLLRWSDLKIRPQLLVGIKQAKFQYPSQLQSRVLPEIMTFNNRDILCQSKPGTGKTAVFILSILNMLSKQNDGQYLTHHCIVAVSTRELAHQVLSQFKKLSVGFVKPELRISCYFGGLSLWDSKYELKTKSLTPHIIIGTLGRLRHLISQNHIRTDHVKYIVVDECDKIVDNSQNLQDLKYLLRKTPESKQLLLFTATLPPKTLDNCLAIMKKTKQPFILTLDNKKLDYSNLKHYFQRITEIDKLSRLNFVLDTFQFDQAIIFANVIEKAMGITDLLRLNFFNPVCIHSKLPQAERLQLYDWFKNQNSSKILVATDIFGRGIDFRRVNLVINYDFPKEATMYLHRAARADRFGQNGTVVSFIRAEISEDVKISKDEYVFRSVKDQFNVKFERLNKTIPPHFFN